MTRKNLESCNRKEYEEDIRKMLLERNTEGRTENALEKKMQRDSRGEENGKWTRKIKLERESQRKVVERKSGKCDSEKTWLRIKWCLESNLDFEIRSWRRNNNNWKVMSAKLKKWDCKLLEDCCKRRVKN